MAGSPDHLETYARELSAAVEILAGYRLRSPSPSNSGSPSSNTSHLSQTSSGGPQLVIPPDAPCQVHRARRVVLANVAKLQRLLDEPNDFLQSLASQSQILACLHWLGTFQVLACIPLSGSVLAKDVADLAGVPESQLLRVVRMTATAGFLQETSPKHIAHTPLSAPFVLKPSYLDAAMFMAETQAPASLHMAAATQRFGDKPASSSETPYNVAFNTSQPFQAACEQRPKLQRQWPAFFKYAGDTEDAVTEVLTRLDWQSLGEACVVEVGAHTTATAMVLAELQPALHFIVQMSPSVPAMHYNSSKPGSSQASTSLFSPPLPSPPLSTSTSTRSTSPLSLSPVNGNSAMGLPKDPRLLQFGNRITVQKRQTGSVQPVTDAAVYIIRLPSPSPLASSTPSSTPSPSHAPSLFSSPSAQSINPISQSISAIKSHILAELHSHLPILRTSPSSTLILTTRIVPDPGTVDPDVEGVARTRDLALLQLGNERELELAEVVGWVEGVRDKDVLGGGGRLKVVNFLKQKRSGITVALGVKYVRDGEE